MSADYMLLAKSKKKEEENEATFFFRNVIKSQYNEPYKGVVFLLLSGSSKCLAVENRFD